MLGFKKEFHNTAYNSLYGVKEKYSYATLDKGKNKKTKQIKDPKDSIRTKCDTGPCMLGKMKFWIYAIWVQILTVPYLSDLNPIVHQYNYHGFEDMWFDDNHLFLFATCKTSMK